MWQSQLTGYYLDCAAICSDVQAAFTSIICATLFLRTHIAPDGIDNAHLYAGFLFFASLQMFFNGIAEMTFTVGTAHPSQNPRTPIVNISPLLDFSSYQAVDIK